MRTPINKSRNELTKLFSYLGACSKWEVLYKDNDGNFYYSTYVLEPTLTTKESAEYKAWSHINRNQKANPTKAQVDMLLA